MFIVLITNMAGLSRGCKPRINTSEIPVKLSHEIMISSHVKNKYMLSVIFTREKITIAVAK